jgi:hypothetical protein
MYVVHFVLWHNDAIVESSTYDLSILDAYGWMLRIFPGAEIIKAFPSLAAPLI